MRILGLAARSHDSGIALLNAGEIELVYEEERFNREKHTRAYPHLALDALFVNGLTPGDIGTVAMPWNINALRRTARGLWMKNFPTSLNLLRPGAHGPISYWIVAMRPAIWADMKRRARGGRTPAIVEVNHHDAHAATFLVSPFDEAAVLVIDGYGDTASTSFYTGHGNRLTHHWSNTYLDSLGLLYSLTTSHLGFGVFGDEGKVMGLAAYGTDSYVERFDDLVRLEPGGRYALNMEYFSFDVYGGLKPLTGKFFDVFGPAYTDCRHPDTRQKDIAFALQATLEKAILHVVRAVQEKTGLKKLVFSGGVAMNCVANGKIVEHTGFEEIWVPPCASDTGAPLGAALWHHHQTLKQPRTSELTDPFLGTSYGNDDIARCLRDAGLEFESLTPGDLVKRTASALEAGKIVGWFQGRFEMGPRALGNRSILADPRRAEMKDIINARIKHREGFRPFAPAVLAEAAHEYFEIDQPDPFMTIAPRVREAKKSVIPAVVHADGTARFQTVDRATNPRYYDLIAAFGERTGVPVLLNTSFNKHEPIVTRPAEAISCYLRTGMDALAIGDFFVEDRNPAAITRVAKLFDG